LAIDVSEVGPVRAKNSSFLHETQIAALDPELSVSSVQTMATADWGFAEPKDLRFASVEKRNPDGIHFR
jgi:hypothetical protein